MRYHIIDTEVGVALTPKQTLALFKQIWDKSQEQCYERFNNSMNQDNLNTIPEWDEFKKTL